MINIVTCAYRSAAWAERHIKSIQSQKGAFIHWIGVDGCEDSLKAYTDLIHDRMRLFYSPVNLGKGKMQNSLINKITERSTILTFDSDDYMAPDTIIRLPVEIGNRIYSLPYRNNGRYMTGYANGVLLFNRDVYMTLGGVRVDIMVGEDTDFIRRYEGYFMANVIRIRGVEPFYRTVHKDSLSHAPERAHHSPERRRWKQMSREGLMAKRYVIPYECVELAEIV